MIMSLPLLVFSLIAYNAIVFLTGSTGVAPVEHFTPVLFTMPLISGAKWSFSIGDALLTVTFVLLFMEILKSTRTGGHSLVDHALSTIIFIVCLIEFLVVPEAGTSLFFFITVVTLIDVIAGFSVTIIAARRDFAVGPEGH